MRVLVVEVAEQDLGRIYDFNLCRSIDWADKVERRLIERARALALNPHVGRLTTREGVRRLSVTDVQYVIDYRIAGDAVEILRFQSTREIH